MASQMIDTILSAEKECDKRLNDASAKAAAIRADAAKKQAEILAVAHKDSVRRRSGAAVNAVAELFMQIS